MSSTINTRPTTYAHAYDTPWLQPEVESVKLLLDQPELPERNILHPYALNIRDIKRHMDIRWVHIKSGVINRNATVLRQPYRLTTISPVTGTKQVCWMIEVATINRHNLCVHEEWSLAAMGVVPFEDRTGRHWNEQAYTIAR